MANKFIKKSPKPLKHCYESNYPSSLSPTPDPPEPDKSKSISELTRPQLWAMLSRLRDEADVQRLIRELKRNAGEKDTYEKPFEIDTKTPISQLYHFGTKGQKWGVRRFQNEDGTRTPAGKKRHGNIEKSEDHKNSRSSKAKATEGLSNDELRKLNERLQLEDTYKKLTVEKIEKSESWVKEAIKKGGKDALGEFSKGVFLGSAKLLVKEISPQFAEVAFKVKKDKDKD